MSSPESSALALRGLPVAVTGGAGFIGSHLVDALVAQGARVRVLDDLSTGRRENLAAALSTRTPGTAAPGNIELIEGDLRDAEACRAVCSGAALLFHQAALGSVPRSLADPAATLAVNVAGTGQILAAALAAGVRRVVYASSSSVYGDTAELPAREGGEGRPLSPYALSKVAGEQLAELFGRCHGLEAIGLRYFNVYGPRQSPAGRYAAVVPRFFAACLAGEAPVIYGDGEQSRDFTFVEDAVHANLLAATAPAAVCGRAYNVAGGAPVSINELARQVRDLVGTAGPEPRHEPARPGEARRSLADLTAAGAALGYRARTPLAQGLRACLAHYREAPAAGAAEGVEPVALERKP